MKKNSKKLIAKKIDMEKFNNFVIFQTENGKVNVDVFFQNDTLWLTQKMIAELFEVNVPAISKHLKNIFETEELKEKAVVSILETTAKDGKKYKTKYFNLKTVLSVGYRVNSYRAIEFRKWANLVLDKFLELSNYSILTNTGKFTALEAKIKAGEEYDKFRVVQDKKYISDFDKHIKKLKSKN